MIIRWSDHAACCLLMTAAMLLASSSSTLADEPGRCSGSLGTEQILDCLRPPARTRELTFSSKGVVVEGPEAPQAVAAVNLIVNFEFDSARLTNDGIISLDALGKALSSPALRDMRFQIAGHTDAVGTEAYNQRLSEQRAEAVRDYLTGSHHLEPARLEVVGYGKGRPYDPSNPDAAINRRVQITRLPARVGP